MLNFLIDQCGAERSELPVLVKLNDMLAEENTLPTSLPKETAVTAPNGTAAVAVAVAKGAPKTLPVSEKPVGSARGVHSMLEFLMSPLIVAEDGIDDRSFPTLSLLEAELAADNAADTTRKKQKELADAEAVSVGRAKRVAPSTDGEKDGQPSGEEADAAATTSSQPMAIPLPIVPGMKDWSGTHTVTVAPPPLPTAPQETVVRELHDLTAADLSSEVPTPLHKKKQPSPSRHRIEVHAATETVPKQNGRTSALPKQLVEERVSELTAGRPRVGNQRPSSAMVTGNLPRSVAAALQQRRSSEGGVAASAAPPVKRSAFIDRYMDKLYARAAAIGTADVAPAPAARGSHSIPERRPSVGAPAAADPSSYERVVAQLSRPLPRHRMEEETAFGGCQVRPHALRPQRGAGAGGPARFVYDQRLQQYRQLPHSSFGARPVSSTPALPAVHRSARGTLAPLQRQRPPRLQDHRAGGDSSLDLTIVGARLAVPSVVPPVRPTGRASNG